MVESFNKEVKRLLEKIYLEETNTFSIYIVLSQAIQIYNNNRHSSKKYRPNDIFFITDEVIIKKVIKNIKISQKKIKILVILFQLTVNVCYVKILN